MTDIYVQCKVCEEKFRHTKQSIGYNFGDHMEQMHPEENEIMEVAGTEYHNAVDELYRKYPKRLISAWYKEVEPTKEDKEKLGKKFLTQTQVIELMKGRYELGCWGGVIGNWRYVLQKGGLGKGGDTKYPRVSTVRAMLRKRTIEEAPQRKGDTTESRYRLREATK